MQKKEKALDRIIRVDHAGEYGARRIYEGQMRALKNSDVYATLKEMHEHEKEHLDYFTDQIKQRQSRPTVMLPIWHVGGYAMGFITGMMGKKAAMACTIAVEEVIGEHYQKQEDELNEFKDESSLQKNIAKFKLEELEHKEIGHKHDAESVTGYALIYGAVRKITQLAIKISERI